jgi:hypothetical protein
MKLTRQIAAMLTASFLAMVVGCRVRVAGPPPPPPPGGFAQVDIVDENGWHHHGYWDDQHVWHGGYYDANHSYHDDPGDWHH